MPMVRVELYGRSYLRNGGTVEWQKMLTMRAKPEAELSISLASAITESHDLRCHASRVFSSLHVITHVMCPIYERLETAR